MVARSFSRPFSSAADQEAFRKDIALLSPVHPFSAYELTSLLHRRLHHPNLLTPFDGYVAADASAFVLSEFMVGGNARDMLRRSFSQGEPLTIPQLVGTISDICRGLSYLHSRGLAHWDLHPANVLFGEEGRVRLSDFGFSHVRSAYDVT